ncbi:MAG: BRO-N domain-containing protein [Cetobacterium sp.]
MNQLINLSGDYVTFDVGNKKSQKVKIVGTHKHPYFCGKDVCEILGYIDVHDAIYKHVKPKYKKDLKTLNEELSVNLGDNYFGSEHLKNINYHSGKAVYVNEPGLYSLIMKSKASFAEAFQDFVYEIILPSIRQHGAFSLEQEFKEKLALKDEQIQKERQEKEEAKAKLRSETAKLKEQVRKTLEFNQATKKIDPHEYIYIATTESNQRTSKFKVGGCQSFDLLKTRLNQYNCGESDTDDHYFVYLKKTVSYRAIEHAITGMLVGFRENRPKELYFIHFDWLVKCIDAIIEGNAEFAVFVNQNREQMVQDTITKEAVMAPPIQLEQIKIAYVRAGDEPQEIEIMSDLDLETVDLIKDAISSYVPTNNIVKRSNFEEHLKGLSPEIKLEKKKRMIWKVVQQIGPEVQPMWRFKY